MESAPTRRLMCFETEPNFSYIHAQCVLIRLGNSASDNKKIKLVECISMYPGSTAERRSDDELETKQGVFMDFMNAYREFCVSDGCRGHTQPWEMGRRHEIV